MLIVWGLGVLAAHLPMSLVGTELFPEENYSPIWGILLVQLRAEMGWPYVLARVR